MYIQSGPTTQIDSITYRLNLKKKKIKKETKTGRLCFGGDIFYIIDFNLRRRKFEIKKGGVIKYLPDLPQLNFLANLKKLSL